MVPTWFQNGLVSQIQNGSDKVPQRLDLTIASYLQGFAMVPGMLQEGSDMLPQRFVVRVREKASSSSVGVFFLGPYAQTTKMY